MSNAPSRGELILYRTEDGRNVIRLRVVDGTVWLAPAACKFLGTPVVKGSLTTGDGEGVAAATCKDYLQVHEGRPTRHGLSP